MCYNTFNIIYFIITSTIYMVSSYEKDDIYIEAHCYDPNTKQSS